MEPGNAWSASSPPIRTGRSSRSSATRAPGTSSARKHRDALRGARRRARAWRRSTEAALDAHERHGERVLVVTYEQLVLDAEGTMRRVAERIGIDFSPVLLEPTFNGRAARANSSEPVQDYGILRERTTAYRQSLDAETLARIEELAGGLYERAESLAAPVPSIGE